MQRVVSGTIGFGPGSSSRPLSLRGIALRIFITCWLVYAAHFATNTVREIYPALSLGDHLSFDVSEYLGLHPDIFELPGRGVFINNNPGASILGAVPYAIARPVIDLASQRVQESRAASPEGVPEYDTEFPLRAEFYRKAYEKGLDVKFALASGVTQAFLMAPLSALSAVVMFLVLARLTGSVRASAILALLYAFATPVFYRTAQLNHNLLLGHVAFFAFVLLWRPWESKSDQKKPFYFMAGLLAGWAVVLDYSGIVAMIALSGYALFRWRGFSRGDRSAYDLALFAAGVALSGAVLVWYQWASFGHPIYPAQHYMPATDFVDQGFSGFDWPNPDLLWRSAVGTKFGLFAFAPILILALYLPGWFNPRIRILESREVAFILLFTAGFFIFGAANQYGYVQFNTGVRHMVPVTPFLFLLAAGVFLRLPLVAAVPIGVVTTYWSWSLAMYREVGDNHPLGVIDAVLRITLEGVRLPWLTTLEQLNYLPSGFLAGPLLLLLALCIWTVWRVRWPMKHPAGVTLVKA